MAGPRPSRVSGAAGPWPSSQGVTASPYSKHGGPGGSASAAILARVVLSPAVGPQSLRLGLGGRRACSQAAGLGEVGGGGLGPPLSRKGEPALAGASDTARPVVAPYQKASRGGFLPEISLPWTLPSAAHPRT